MREVEFLKKFGKRSWIALALIVSISAVGYSAVREFTLNMPSTVVVVEATPGLELITGNDTVVSSIAFGNIPQGGMGTWSGYLRNSGNIVLHTFSIGSSDLGSVGTVIWDLPASTDLPVNQTVPVTIILYVNQTSELGSHAFSIQIVGSDLVTGPTTIKLTATDPDEGYPRTWDFTFDRSMPPYGPGGVHTGADIIEAHFPGDTMTILRSFSAGPHYLVFSITQTGGPAYGVYSGTIAVNGRAYSFSGIDWDDNIRIDFVV
jgi:hypothetical protein